MHFIPPKGMHRPQMRKCPTPDRNPPTFGWFCTAFTFVSKNQ